MGVDERVDRPTTGDIKQIDILVNQDTKAAIQVSTPGQDNDGPRRGRPVTASFSSAADREAACSRPPTAGSSIRGNKHRARGHHTFEPDAENPHPEELSDHG